MSRWFRVYDDMLDDPKVQMLSPELFKTWMNLLAVASRNDGKLPPVHKLAFSLRCSQQDMQSRVDDLVMAELIDILPDGSLEPHNWAKRQWKSDDSKDRVRKHRDKKRQETAGNEKCNGDVTVTVAAPESEAETDTDSKKIDADDRVSAAQRLDGLQDKLEEAAGEQLENYARAPGLMNLSTPLMWLEQGCDLERDVLPAIRVVAARRKGRDRISDWNYFTQAVSNAKRDRERGLPPPSETSRAPERKPQQGGVYAELQRQKALRSESRA